MKQYDINVRHTNVEFIARDTNGNYIDRTYRDKPNAKELTTKVLAKRFNDKQIDFILSTMRGFKSKSIRVRNSS